ncbi:phage tail protein [Flavobacterium rhizosphaerae]|uniref:Tail fiber protein n=1 Tax=Flavobacterium rhizosphaerae TaxID=3163298 RepID=A0ABW8YW61_9FLAO
MFDQYIGSFVPFAGVIYPINLIPCDGRLLQINQYQALFSIIGYSYGNYSSSQFRVPDLRGRFAIGDGAAPGMVSEYDLTEYGGYESIVLDVQSLPTHNHAANFTSSGTSVAVNLQPKAGPQGNSNSPAGNNWGTPNSISLNPVQLYSKTKNVTMNANAVQATIATNGQTPGTIAVGTAGNSAAHNNMSPYTAISWFIVADGIYPNFS